MELIAHRGASGYAPENTISAFKKAIEMGLDTVEFDVQFTADKEAVVIHDYSLERTSNGTGKVKDYKLKELKKLDFGSWFGDKFKNERIATLVEVLETVKNNSFINIELKRDKDDKRFFSKEILKIIENLNVYNKVIISSFDHELLKNIYNKDKNIKIALLFPKEVNNFEGLKEYIDKLGIKICAVNPHKDSLNEKSIKNIKKLGLKINSYTVNSYSEYTRLEKLGVDSVFTNFPNLRDENI